MSYPNYDAAIGKAVHPIKNGQISSDMTLLNDAIEETHKSMAELEGRLSGVIQPMPAQVSGQNTAPSIVRVGLAEQINESKMRVRYLNTVILSVLERLEL